MSQPDRLAAAAERIASALESLAVESKRANDRVEAGMRNAPDPLTIFTTLAKKVNGP